MRREIIKSEKKKGPASWKSKRIPSNTVIGEEIDSNQWSTAPDLKNKEVEEARALGKANIIYNS